MTASICGIGVVGGFGCGLPALERALTGARVEPTTVSIAAREGRVLVPCLVADTARLTDFVPGRTLRRMSHYIRMGLLASFEAMADAGLLEPARRGRLGVVVATAHGATGNNYAFQYPFDDREEICGSPTRFSNSVHNAAAAYISIALKETGPNHSVTHEDLSFPSALLTAVAWLRQRRVDAVLVGGVDELNHARAYAWYAHHRRPAAPRDEGRAPALPLAGEGACFLVLKAAEPVATAYGTLREVRMGRALRGSIPRPVAPCTILGTGGAGAPPADYRPWIAPQARSVSYASAYGDLPVDSAFDVAIAALSRRQNRLFADAYPSPAAAPEPLAGRPIACLKLGVGDTYGWALLE